MNDRFKNTEKMIDNNNNMSIEKIKNIIDSEDIVNEFKIALINEVLLSNTASKEGVIKRFIANI